MKLNLSVLLITCLLCIKPVGTQAIEKPVSLDELLSLVRQEQSTGEEADKEREENFLSQNAAQQQKLIQEAKARVTAQERRSLSRKVLFDWNENQIDLSEIGLKKESGSLGVLFEVVRRQARETADLLKSSLVSAQKPGRSKVLYGIAKQKTLPTIKEMEALWLILLTEMNASGKVVRFNAPVISAAGKAVASQVTRIGLFNLISEGRYLRYLTESGQLATLIRQPPSRFTDMAEELEKATSGVTAVGIDPSRGAILSLLVQKHDTAEHMRQGGLIGYLIMSIGVIALLLVCERFAYLSLVGRRIYAQIKSDQPNTDNALGRILSVYTKEPDQEVEVLEHRLDEAILKEIPVLERGLKTVAILAAIAPLLGLLGTVTGMIETFQSITLFGTGDPKLMSGGISQALVTTELGLVVAIPIVLLHSFISGKSNRLVQILDEQSSGIVARLAEKKA